MLQLAEPLIFLTHLRRPDPTPSIYHSSCPLNTPVCLEPQGLVLAGPSPWNILPLTSSIKCDFSMKPSLTDLFSVPTPIPLCDPPYPHITFKHIFYGCTIFVVADWPHSTHSSHPCWNVSSSQAGEFCQFCSVMLNDVSWAPRIVPSTQQVLIT